MKNQIDYMILYSYAKKYKVQGKIWSLIRFVLIVGLSFIILYPVMVKLSTSFKSIEDMYDPTVFFIPKNPTWEHFILVFKSTDYIKSIFTSIGICSLLALLQTFSCTLVANGLARYKFPFNKLIFSLVVFTLIVPPQTVLMPLFLKFKYFNVLETFNFTGNISGGTNLINTIWPFIMISSFAVAFKNGLFIFMLRQFFKNIPIALEEAANIDGCGIFGAFFRVILPGARSMLITVFLFAFVWQWNDFYYVNVLAPNLPIVSLKLSQMNFATLSYNASNFYGGMLNSPRLILLIIPLIILYIFTQRFFVESVEKSGITG